MDRQEFNRLINDKISSLNASSITISEVNEGSLSLEVVSNEFIGFTVLKRIEKIYELIISVVEQADFHIEIIALTVNEKFNGKNEQSENSNNDQKRSTGYAAHSI